MKNEDLTPMSSVKIPSENTARIQEAHIFVGHIICELVERDIFAES